MVVIPLHLVVAALEEEVIRQLVLIQQRLQAEMVVLAGISLVLHLGVLIQVMLMLILVATLVAAEVGGQELGLLDM